MPYKRASPSRAELAEELMLRDALEKDTNTLGEALLRENERLKAQGERIPEVMEERLTCLLTSRTRRRSVFVRVRHIANVAAVFLLLFLVTGILCMTVAGIQNKVTDFLMQCKGYMAVNSGAAYVNYGDIENRYEILHQSTVNGIKTVILRLLKTGETATVTEQGCDSAGVLDTEDAEYIETVTVTRQDDGQYIEKTNLDGYRTHQLYWMDDTQAYTVFGNIPRETVLMIARDYLEGCI